MDGSLSSHLKSALCHRAPTEVLFQLAQVEDAHCQLCDVTLSQWAAFVRAVLRRVPTTPRDAPSSSSPACFSLTCDVAILCRETFHACLVESACVCGGRTFCLLNPDDPPRRLEALCEEMTPSVRLTDTEVRDMLHAAQAESRHGEVAVTPLAWRATVDTLVLPCEDATAAYYIYTSGSTGMPKCVVGTRANLSAYGRVFSRDAAGLACTAARSQFLTLSTPFFDPSLGDMMCVLLSAHGWQRMVPRACLVNGDLPLLLAAQPWPTHIVSTPALWNTIPPSMGGTSGALLPASTKLFLGGERMTQTLVDAWASVVELHNIYGVTEATVYQSVKRVPPGMLAEHVTCGRGTATTTLTIRRPLRDGGNASGDDGEASDEECGEIVLCGPQVCLGYGADLAATGYACAPFHTLSNPHDREYWTGDLARWVPGGDGHREIQLVGRRDAQVKVNGQRTSLEEVEAVMQHTLGAAVVECCCGARQDATGKTIIVAGCVMVTEESDHPTDTGGDVCFRDHTPALERGVQALLRQRLPPHAVPSAWLLLPSSAPPRLPRTATGKLDRRRVAVLARLTSTEASAETDELHAVPMSLRTRFTTVKRIWEAELGVPVHPRTNFFLAGGDSLGALKLCRAVFMALDGRDDVIDTCGGLPTAFRPHVLMQQPRLVDYVMALSTLLDAGAPSEREAVQEGQARPATHVPTLAPLDEAALRGTEALLAAVSVGNTPLAELLVSHRVSAVDGLYSRTTRCMTPLHVATTLDKLAMVDMLLRHGAKSMAVSPDGVTPLHIAAGTSLVVLERLLDAPDAAVQCRDRRQQSLLHVAARRGCVAVVRYLLAVHGLDVAVRDKWQRSPAHWAVLHGDVAVLRAMAEACEASADQPHEANRARHRTGGGKGRFTRLAERRTTLVYETLPELAARVAPDSVEMRELCESLSAVVEQ